MFLFISKRFKKKGKYNHIEAPKISDKQPPEILISIFLSVLS